MAESIFAVYTTRSRGDIFIALGVHEKDIKK